MTMKKSTIWILGVVMGLSFISLLYLQISYIEEMVKMRNEQFDESVKRALMAASKDVESAEVDRWLREDISEAEKKAWEKCNPRCLRKLYLVTQAEIDRGVRLLAEQAYDRLLDTEQLAVGWDELPEQKKAAQ